MQKNKSSYSSNPSLYQTYVSQGNDRQQHFPYQKQESYQSQHRQRVDQQSTSSEYGTTGQSRKNIGGATNEWNNQVQRQKHRPSHQQFEEEEQIENAGHDQILDHTFSEDSNSENSQIMQASENKEIRSKGGSSQQNFFQEEQYAMQRNKRKMGSESTEIQNPNKPAKKRTLAIITLDVGGGNSDVIHVQEGDDLNILAKNFCMKHNLDDECIQYIIKNIEIQLEKRRQRKEERRNAPDSHPKETVMHQKNSSKREDNNNFRKSSESPKFPGVHGQSHNGNYQPGQQESSQKSNNGKHLAMQYGGDENNSRKKRHQQPSFGQNQFFEQPSPQKQQMVYEQINEEEFEDQSISVAGQSGNVSLPEETYEYQQSHRMQPQPPSSTKSGFIKDSQINKPPHKTFIQQPYQQQQQNQNRNTFGKINQYNQGGTDQELDGQRFDERQTHHKQQHNIVGNKLKEKENKNNDIFDYQEFNPNVNYGGQRQNGGKAQKISPQFTDEEGEEEKNFLALREHNRLGDQNQHDDLFLDSTSKKHSEKEDDSQVQQRKKIIEQISQKLNFDHKRNPQLPAVSLQSPPIQKASKPKGKTNSLQSQLEAKKEQFFNSYYSQLQPQEEEDGQREEMNSPVPKGSERYFESPQPLQKSRSNNNLEKGEEKSGAQQSYEQWQRILSNKANGQKVQIKVKRLDKDKPSVSSNTGKVFQIQTTGGGGASVSPRNLSKNKSASQLNQNSGNVLMPSSPIQNSNKMTGRVTPNNNNNQALSNSPPTLHEKLYIQGLEQMERKRRAFEENQERSREREVVGSTFHPSVSPKSRTMKLQEGTKIEDYLLLEGRKTKERKAIAQIIKDEDSKQECSFKPHVSVVSQKIAEHQQSQSSSNFSSIHERLFKQGEKDKITKEEWNNEQFYKIYPFSPDIGVNKNRKLPEKTQKEFANRLLEEKSIIESKSLLLRQKENSFVDKQTGQKLFQPLINKDEVYQRVSKRIDLQDQLLQEELQTHHMSPISSKQQKGREVNPPRMGQLKWDDLLRDNREPQHYEVSKSQIKDSKNRSMTPSRTLKTLSEFEESSYIPLTSRAAHKSPSEEIENILSQSPFRNKKVIIKPSKSKDKLLSIPLITLDRKTNAVTTNFSKPSASNSNLLKSSNNSKLQKNESSNGAQTNPSYLKSNYNNNLHASNDYNTPTPNPQGTTMNQSHLSATNRSKSQINLNPNQTQLQLSTISQFDNGRVFNDHKLSEKIAYLFDQFDSDGDGRINSQNIDISKTDPEILEIIQNVLYEIDEKSLTLNRNQFTQFLCSNNLIIPLKRFYAEKEGELCDEDMTDYDIIRSKISNYSSNSYSTNLNTTNKNHTILNQTNQNHRDGSYPLNKSNHLIHQSTNSNISNSNRQQYQNIPKKPSKNY